MNATLFHELMKSGLGRAILYARDNDVLPFRDEILDACLHCYSADPQCEGTRAGYMLELVSLLPDRQFYCDEVLRSLPHCGDDWDAVQRFHFATYMSFDGDDRAKRIAYESFDPGPRNGEAIAIDFVRMDGSKGLVFAAAKIGALLISNPDEVDEGWLWSKAVEICGEANALSALSEAGSSDSGVEAYWRAVTADAGKRNKDSKDIEGLPYDDLVPLMTGLSNFRLRRWGMQAGFSDFEDAARGLVTAGTYEAQLRHLRIFSGRPFPRDPAPLLILSTSENADVAYAATVAISKIQHPSVRAEALRLAGKHLPGREWAIEMLDGNWELNDHETVLSWFEAEQDRYMRHRMQSGLRAFWKNHPDPTTEVRMLHASYEKGPCSFCREQVVERLIELDSLSESLREECAYDASDEIRELVGPAS